MAGNDDTEISNFSEQMPAPPQFWKSFTKSNLKALEELQAKAEPIPVNLNNLIPPKTPADGKYRNFGGQFDIHQLLPSLEEQGQEQLYSNNQTNDTTTADKDWTLDRALHLKQIVRSILLNFLEMVSIISEDPTSAEIKLQHLTTLFLNAHHIINEYRPHQARESIISTMEERIALMREEIDKVKQIKMKIEALPSTLPLTETLVSEIKLESKESLTSQEHQQNSDEEDLDFLNDEENEREILQNKLDQLLLENVTSKKAS